MKYQGLDCVTMKGVEISTDEFTEVIKQIQVENLNFKQVLVNHLKLFWRYHGEPLCKKINGVKHARDCHLRENEWDGTEQYPR